MSKPTLCIHCDRVHSDTVNLPPWQRRCTAVRIEPGYGFVDPYYAPNPPYELCGRINKGDCEFFVPSRAYEQA